MVVYVYGLCFCPCDGNEVIGIRFLWEVARKMWKKTDMPQMKREIEFFRISHKKKSCKEEWISFIDKKKITQKQTRVLNTMIF